MVLELRSGAKINNNNDVVENNNESSPQQKRKSGSQDDPNGMTLVVFFGLLLDLLAFTLILPLLPALLDHYKAHDAPGGLYHNLNSRVSKKAFVLNKPIRTFNEDVVVLIYLRKANTGE